ncbi:MAG: phosphoribosylamine--glycine ligase [Pseudomonadota bacterium]
MNVLIVGGGGREHALAWKAACSTNVEAVFCAPGNAGTASEPKVSNLKLGVEDIDGLLDFAKTNSIDLTIIGPEAPLVAGIVDQFHAAGLKCFGPSKAAAALEGSKAYMKDFLTRHNIPTAIHQAFTDEVQALAFLAQQALPIVIKADGLAAGKGVVIAHDRAHAERTVCDMLSGQAFGNAGRRIVIEEFLDGEEASFIVMTDGETIIPFASSQDHKARDDGDQGPNTGGMGAYSPAPIVNAEMHQRILDEVIEPTLAGLRKDNNPYVGFLYAGLMVMPNGEVKVLEFNCRFGDPETQPIMMRLNSDLASACMAVLEGNAKSVSLEWADEAAVGVVMASGGYPASTDTGHPIGGLEPATSDADGITKVFHAGTSLSEDSVLNSGGRVLCVVGLGGTVTEAQKHAYERTEKINWQGAFYRRDIGYRAIAHGLQLLQNFLAWDGEGH